MQIKIKLVGSSFLFGEKFSMIRGQEKVLDSDKLNIADLEIISHYIRSGTLESTANADDIMSIALELREQVLNGDTDKVFHLQNEASVEVVDAEIVDENGNVTTTAEILERKQLKSDMKTFVADKVVNANGAQALVALKNSPYQTKEDLEYALNAEVESKNRKTVVALIEEQLAALNAKQEEQIQEEEQEEVVSEE